jgi:hypothetical protein
LQAIIEILVPNSATDDTRRTEQLRSCKTLNELKNRLLEEYNIDIARSTLYSRLVI